MNAPIDDLTMMLGSMPPDELEARRKIRLARNAASFNVTRTESPDARALYWMVTETATFWIYRPTEIETLAKVAEYLRGLMISARQVEDLLEAVT